MPSYLFKMARSILCMDIHTHIHMLDLFQSISISQPAYWTLSGSWLVILLVIRGNNNPQFSYCLFFVFKPSWYEFNCYEHSVTRSISALLSISFGVEKKKNHQQTKQPFPHKKHSSLVSTSFITESSTSKQWMWNKWTIPKHTLVFAQHTVQTQAV